MSRIVAAFREAPEVAWGLTVVLAVVAYRNVSFIASTWQFGPDFIRDYQGIWYFVDYRSGFVRRGLVGEAVRLAGITTEQPTTVYAIGVALTILAIASLIALALAVAALGRTPIRGYAAAIVLLVSPLFIALPVRDLARLDTVGVVCGALLLIVLLPRRIPVIAGAIAAVLLLVVATATEEFLLAYLAPVAIAALASRLLGDGVRRWGAFLAWSAITIAPAALVLAWSYASPVSRSAAEIIVVKTGGPLWEGGQGSPAWSLTQTTEDGRAFVATFPDHAKTVVLACIAFAVVALALQLLLRPPLTALLVLAYLAAVSFALGTVAVDVQRWWGLALMSFAASAVALACGRRDADIATRPGTVARTATGLLVGASLVIALTPAFPKMAAGFATWSELAWRTLAG